MRNLYIHCGLPKTGTTAIQRFLTAERDKLADLGFDYPQLGLCSFGIAHHNLSNELFGHNDFNPERGSIRDFLDYLERPERKPNVIISSEGFINCVSSQRSQQGFLDFLRAAITRNDNIYVILAFRMFSKYFDSWYVQRLKTGNLEIDIPAYVDASKIWMRRLFKSLELLREVVGEDRLVIIDLESGDGDAISAVLSRLKIPLEQADSLRSRANEKLGLKKAAYIYQFHGNAHYIPRQTSERAVLLMRNLLRLSEFPDETYRYRVVPYRYAAAIQRLASRKVPQFLAAKLERVIRPEDERFQAVDLSSVVLTAEEKAFLDQAIPVQAA